MEYLAHSARDGCPAQSYQNHIENVRRDAAVNAKSAAYYATLDGNLLIDSVEMASYVHDLGKLNEENQAVLHQENSRAALPVHHQEAGVAFLKQSVESSFCAQLAVSSHHSGLPDFVEEEGRDVNFFRDKDIKTRKIVDSELSYLGKIHQGYFPAPSSRLHEEEIQGDAGVFSRILLSCLSDADHTDTARHYKKFPQEEKQPLLMPEKRLECLDAYVATLGGEDERSRLRAEMYWACRNSLVEENIAACDSPVGSGKTTAVMAHLLKQAAKRKSRRIFVVLPFTNIISQSVDVYRKALVLPGENPEAVVAELHHRADFESEDIRALTAQWRAPIIVTTAVAFFETLASNMPSALRRLHELPGSVIFVDEAHAALPVKLLTVAWHWMQILADEWKCYWVLASGSLVEFWKIKGIAEKTRYVPQIVSGNLRNKLITYEDRRINFGYRPDPISRIQLVEWVASSPGPRLLIMNTVQNAAVLAVDLRKYYGKENENKVMHLSTALNADDREKTIRMVKKRLNDRNDMDWTLVATSCVEAGVDFSFKTGFREIASLLSLLQAAGRINRSGLDSEAKIWSFIMQDDFMLTDNKGTKDSAYVLNRYFRDGVPICPQLSSKSIQDELQRETVVEDAQKILNAELCQQFPTVREEFRVIEKDTVLVVADSAVKNQLCFGGCDWKTIQRKAIPIYSYRVRDLHLKLLADGIFDWNLEYDDFIGIMKGFLAYLQLKFGVVIL